MAKKLRTFVHVDGVAYGPESEVPAEVAKRITAPGVWEGDEDTDQAAKESTSGDAGSSSSGRASSGGAAGGDSSTGGSGTRRKAD